MPVLNKVFQTTPRPVIILAILIRLVKTLIYRNKKEIINRIMTAPRVSVSYA